MSCPRAGLSLQTQHSLLFPLLSLPFRIFISSFIIMLSIIWYLLLPRTFFPFTIPSRASFSRQFLLSQWPSQFRFLLSLAALFFLLPLSLAELHFLFFLFIYIYIYIYCIYMYIYLFIYSGSLIWSKTAMELIFNHVVNFGEVRRAQLVKSTLLTSSLVPLGSFQIF